MFSLIDDLGCHIGWGSTKRLNSIMDRGYIRQLCTDEAETKINYFDFHQFIQKNILGFNVSVDNILAMKIGHSLQYLSEENFGF